MKSLLALVIAQCFTLSVFAQDTATSYTDYTSSSTIKPLKRHSITTRIGEGFMIGGGDIVAGAIIGYVASGGANPNQSSDQRFGNDILVTLISAAGINIALDGLIVFIVGKSYERRHPDRYSAFSRGNNVGLSYNFR